MGSKLKMCFLALFLCLLAPAHAWGQTGFVTGTIRDTETGRGIPGATVQALESSGRMAASTITNAEGRYRVSVSPGSYTLTVQTVGYAISRGTPVTVAANGTATIDISIRTEAIQLNPIVISASRREEKATDAPAHVEVISEREIALRPTVTPVDHLRATPGVDIITQGVQSTNVVARGFNNVFSGALHIITDNRLTGVPSLRVNVMHFNPTTSEDLQRMEVVLGPGAALYGPNTASGVLHLITKSPLVFPGSTVSLMAGERDILQGSFRTGHRVSDRLGFKLSGQVMTGTEWVYNDPDEVAERAKFFSADSVFFRLNFQNSLGLSESDARARIATVGARDNDIGRWSGEGRVDFQVTPELSTVLQAGVTNVSSGIELTGLGAGQVKDWRYSYVQGRMNWNRLFAQLYLNMSDAGDTYLLRTGQPIVDESTLLVGQVQHGFNIMGGRQGFTYGADYFFTNPQTRGTINGQYEDKDETTEIGAYLQSETALTPQFDLVLAGRIDDHSALPDPVLSPRAAIVFKPAEDQAFRATFNRAFSTPTSLNQFLDLPTAVPDQTTNPLNAAAARLGYSVRVQGTGTTGFTFRENGAYHMRSPFTPTPLGGPATLLPADAAMFFPAALQVALVGGAGAHPLMTPQRIQFLAGLRPTGAQIGTNFLSAGRSISIDSLNLADIAPIRETTTTTFEVGYKGVLQQRFSIAADVWSSRIQDFVTPLTISTPFLLLRGQEMGTYIATQLIMNGQASPAEAQALAAFLTPIMAQVPVGVISTSQINANGAQMLATYTNVDESLDLWGADLGLQALLTPSVALMLNGSIVSDDHFDTSVGVVTLNAPKKKAALALAYRPASGFNGEVRARYNAEYPVRSGVYEATNCITDESTALPCVESYTLLDLTLGYALPRLPGASVQLAVQNVLDEGYRSFPGVPEIGRLALLRLKYDF
jgi:outer membrane receptor for ferrienterochelin and colicins